MTTLEQIKEQEQVLLQAMLKSNVEALDSLISDDLIFTHFTGQIFNKADDLEMHRSGKIAFESMQPSEQVIKIFGNTAVVSVLMRLKGRFMGQPFESNNRYTRVWVKTNDSWQIVTAHTSLINGG